MKIAFNFSIMFLVLAGSTFWPNLFPSWGIAFWLGWLSCAVAELLVYKERKIT